MWPSEDPQFDMPNLEATGVSGWALVQVGNENYLIFPCNSISLNCSSETVSSLLCLLYNCSRMPVSGFLERKKAVRKSTGRTGFMSLSKIKD